MKAEGRKSPIAEDVKTIYEIKGSDAIPLDAILDQNEIIDATLITVKEKLFSGFDRSGGDGNRRVPEHPRLDEIEKRLK